MNAPSLNVLTDRWIPVERKSGTEERISPLQVTSGFDTDPVVSLNYGRQDANAGLHELLIGVLQTFLPPSDLDHWESRLQTPPDPNEIRERIPDEVVSLFNLHDSTAPFLQDAELDPDDDTQGAIRLLFFEAPGDNAIANNKDWFNKETRFSALCEQCAPTYIFLKQAYATMAGPGYRTGMRGGGPLVTLIQGKTLWGTLWRNTLTLDHFEQFTPPSPLACWDVFGWVRSAGSTEEPEVFPEDTHPLHMYWSMPRRFRLLWDDEGEAPCSVCGRSEGPRSTSLLRSNYGWNYEGPWVHPLTPYRHGNGDEPISQKPQGNRIGYQNWMAYVVGTGDTDPATVVQHYRTDRGDDPFLTQAEQWPEMWVFGYNFDQNTLDNFVESRMPVVPPLSSSHHELIERVLSTSDYCGRILVQALRRALFGRYRPDSPGPPWDYPEDRAPRSNESVLQDVDRTFWTRTESAFREVLQSLKSLQENQEDRSRIKTDWLDSVSATVMDIFDERTSEVPTREEAVARGRLSFMMSPHNETLRDQLDLEAPTRGDEAA